MLRCPMELQGKEKKVDEKQKRDIELKVFSRSIRLRGDELTHISKDVKGGQTSGCAAGNY